MSRRRPSTIDVSLFPFLSILACIMGCLTLLIMAITVGSVSRAGEADDVMSDLHELLAQSVYVESLLNLKIDAPDPAARLQSLKAELVTVGEQLQRLRELVPGEVPTQKPAVVLDPGGQGTDLDATFVDCTEHAIILQPDRMQIGDVEADTSPIFSQFESVVRYRRKQTRIRRGDIETSQVYRQFLEQAEDRNRGTVIFLIRPDGVATFREAQQVARSVGLRYAWLPIPAHGNIDFSKFKIGS